MRPEYRPTLVPVAPAMMLGRNGLENALSQGLPQAPTAESLEIIIQVSNAHFRGGGLPRSIIFGPADVVARNQKARLLSQMFLIGALGLMAIIYGALYAGQPSERSMLYFALLSAAIAVRSFFMGDLPVQMVGPAFHGKSSSGSNTSRGTLAPRVFSVSPPIPLPAMSYGGYRGFTSRLARWVALS